MRAIPPTNTSTLSQPRKNLIFRIQTPPKATTTRNRMKWTKTFLSSKSQTISNLRCPPWDLASKPKLIMITPISLCCLIQKKTKISTNTKKWKFKKLPQKISSFQSMEFRNYWATTMAGSLNKLIKSLRRSIPKWRSTRRSKRDLCWTS